MTSSLTFELYENNKSVKSITANTNTTNISDFLNSLENFRQEVNIYLSDKIEANGVTDSTDDEASQSEDEASQLVSPKKRKK